MTEPSQDRVIAEQTTNPNSSGSAPEPGNPHGEIDHDLVLTSSGTAPTGGEPIGGHADRVQPSDWARKHGSASGQGNVGSGGE